MNKLVLNFALLAALSAGLSAHAQNEKGKSSMHSNTYHFIFLQPDYQVGLWYCISRRHQKDMDRVIEIPGK